VQQNYDLCFVKNNDGSTIFNAARVFVPKDDINQFFPVFLPADTKAEAVFV